MALNKQRLSDSLRDKLINIFQWPTFEQTELEKFTDAMADAIIQEIQDNATVATVLVDGAVDDFNDVVINLNASGSVS